MQKERSQGQHRQNQRADGKGMLGSYLLFICIVTGSGGFSIANMERNMYNMEKQKLCEEGFYGVLLKLMDERRISTANYITFVNPAPHPDRIMSEHDFLYMIDGSWRIREEEEAFEMHSDDLLILPAGRHHYGDGLSTPHNKHMYIHVIPLGSERAANVNGSGFAEGEPGCLAAAEPAEEFAEFPFFDTLSEQSSY